MADVLIFTYMKRHKPRFVRNGACGDGTEDQTLGRRSLAFLDS